MRICIVGGGNIGTAIAAEFAHNGHEVNVLTSRPDAWQKTIVVVNAEDQEIYSGDILLATSDIAAALDSVDYVIITLPSNIQADFAIKAAPFVKSGMKFLMMPGFGGAEFFLQPILHKGGILFGFQRVHAIARLREYGHKVWFDKKQSIQIAALSSSNLKLIGHDMENLFSMPCELLPNYLCITLTPSNPVLHTSRLYTMFRNFNKPWPENKLFYADWTNEASEVLLKLDDEVQSICHELTAIDLSSVLPLKIHYENDTPISLTQKLRSIESLSKILSPMKQTPDGWMPDFYNRYFTCDFNCGLDILAQFAAILHVDAPMMNEIMNWYRRAANNPNRVVDLVRHGLKSKTNIYNFYGVDTKN